MRNRLSLQLSKTDTEGAKEPRANFEHFYVRIAERVLHEQPKSYLA
jgi:hypothetical protein